MNTVETVIVVISGLLLALAILTFVRLIMRRTPPSWAGIRFGVFIERDPSGYSEIQRYPDKEEP